MRRLAMVLLVGSLPTMPAGAEPIRLVTGTDYAPYVDEALPDGGPITLLVQQAFARAGQSVTLTVEPWRQGYEGLLAHRYDATFPYIRTEQRLREVYYSDPIVTVRQHLVVARGNEKAAMVTGWMKDRRICAAVGYAVPAWVNVLIRLGDLSRLTPTQQSDCIEMIIDGRADFMVEAEQITLARRAENGEQPQLVTVPGPAASEGTLHLIVARDHPTAQAVLEHFNRGLAQLRAEGAVPDILLPRPRS